MRKNIVNSGTQWMCQYMTVRYSPHSSPLFVTPLQQSTWINIRVNKFEITIKMQNGYECNEFIHEEYP